MGKNDNLLEMLDYIDPSILSYSEWVSIGMALKYEGYTANDWDKWSKKDALRYMGDSGECFKKWNSFNGANSPVTGGTIYQLAINQGWNPQKESKELDWDAEINDYNIIDTNWIEGKEIKEPGSEWNGVKDLITYLEILFDSTENVGYVTSTWEQDGKFLPTKGHYDRTAGQLIQELSKCNGDIGAVLGDYREEVGAWIRFNPLDGKGVKNDNVTDFRYALVESDSMDLEEQNAILRELELPIACLVYSGKKSIHAIVKINAANYEEYRKRVDYLYNVCNKNGFATDVQNRNPSRLSRMPGVIRNGHKQFLIDTNIGKASYEEWYDWIEAVNDDLPEPENLIDFFDNLPELAPPLIHGVLRQGHKMLLAGPSKAGKSYSLIQLCIAIAEKQKWLGWQCESGKVLYVNLELDRASCLHRFKDVYSALNLKPEHVSNIDIWNLRGKAIPMDKLAPKLIRRAQKKNYIAIIIDPIYKIITGDENSADQMAHFTNQFDKVCTELGSSVIYCHHHSKGYQGNKRSMDRASGSGVFARDPDALLDLMELDIDENIKKQEVNNAIAKFLTEIIKNENKAYFDEKIGLDDTLSKSVMYDHAKKALNLSQYDLNKSIKEIENKINIRTAWRIEGTLREFASFPPRDFWFDYPAHRIDESGVLKNSNPESERAPWQKAIDSRKSKEDKSEDRKRALEIAYEACNMAGEGVTVNDLAEYMGVTKNTIWSRLKEYQSYIKESAPGRETVIKLKYSEE